MRSLDPRPWAGASAKVLGISLGVIATIVVGSVILSLVFPPREARAT